MTIKKTLALIAVTAAYLGNAYAVRSETGAYIAAIVSILTSLFLFAFIVTISKSALIAIASSFWWLSVCMSSLLLPLSLKLADVLFDFGLTGFVCMLFGLLFGYIAFVLFFMLPWEPVREEIR
ncbi:MAG: hypothetical protein Aurels2KO_26400 [Aureliella sp.]